MLFLVSNRKEVRILILDVSKRLCEILGYGLGPAKSRVGAVLLTVGQGHTREIIYNGKSSQKRGLRHVSLRHEH